jgi:hypothetical protein
MCGEIEMCRINAYCDCLFSRTLQAIRASGRKSVPSHRASRHVGTDVTCLLNGTSQVVYIFLPLHSTIVPRAGKSYPVVSAPDFDQKNHLKRCVSTFHGVTALILCNYINSVIIIQSCLAWKWRSFSSPAATQDGLCFCDYHF